MVTCAQPSWVVKVIAASMTRSRMVTGAVTVMRLGAGGERPVERDEVDLLPDTAVGAAPALGDVGPRRAGRETLALVAGHHVVGVAAARAAGSENLVGRHRLAGVPGRVLRSLRSLRGRRRVRRQDPVTLAGREVGPAQVAVEVREHPWVHHAPPDR